MQRGLANLANQRLNAHAYQIFPLAKVALTAFTTRGVRIVSLIEEEDVIERILRHLGLGKRGVRAFGTDPPDETTLGLWLDDSLPDYDIEPDVAFQDYRCPSRLIC